VGIHHGGMQRWEIRIVTWSIIGKGSAMGSKEVHEALAEGWEPFAATTSQPSLREVWLRRVVES